MGSMNYDLSFVHATSSGLVSSDYQDVGLLNGLNLQ
jgi:hypothetical protein